MKPRNMSNKMVVMRLKYTESQIEAIEPKNNAKFCQPRPDLETNFRTQSKPSSHKNPAKGLNQFGLAQANG